MVASTLRAGDVAIIGYNTDDTGTPQDSLSFVLLAPIGHNTKIFFTDRSWNGTTLAASSANEGTYEYTAGSDLPAGTIVTITQSQLSGAGINLSDSSETIYVYQGAINAPTTFLYAADIADGNTTFNGSLVNTGLTAGVTAVAIAGDNAQYGDRGHNQQAPVLLNAIGSSTNWSSDNNTSHIAPSGNLLTAPDQQIWVALAGDAGLVRLSRDGAETTASVQHALFQWIDNPATHFNHPNEIVFDTAHGLFFVADTDLGNRRILQGNIADLYNPGVPPTLTVLYSDPSPVVANGQINGLAIDLNHNGSQGALYFVNQRNFNRIVYDHDGTSPTNQTPVTLATLPAGQLANEVALDIASGRAWIVSTESNTEAVAVPPGTPGAYPDPGNPDNPGGWAANLTVASNNQIWQITGIDRTDTAIGQNTVSSLTFSGVYDDPGVGGNVDFNDLKGLLSSVDIDPTTNFLYFTAEQLNDGVGGFVGGIYRYNLATGAVEELYSETAATDYAFNYIDVDPNTGRYYVSNVSFESPGNPAGTTVNTSSIMTHGLGAGTPTLFAFTPKMNSAGPWGLTIQNAPTVTGSTPAAAVIEASSGPNSGSTASVQLFNSISASDIDTVNGTDELAGAVVRVSGNFQSGATHQDFLTVNGDSDGVGSLASGISFSYNASTGVLTLSGAATTSEYAAALALVTFSTSGDDVTAYDGAKTRTVALSVFDGLLYSDEITNTVSVTGINDAPVNTVGGVSNLSEDVPGSVGSAGPPPTAPAGAITGIQVFDVDADPANHEILVTLKVDVGTIFLRPDVVGGVTDITGNGTNEIILTGTQNQINATLAAMSPLQSGPPVVNPAPNGLTYTPPANYNGQAKLTITTNDVGLNGNDPSPGTGTGTSEEDVDVKLINIADVNDAPTVVNGNTEAHPAILEDTPRTSDALTVAQLFGGHFNDALDIQVSAGNPTGSVGDTLAGIAIVSATSSAVGKWQYHNGAVGDFSDATWLDITAGSMGAARTLTANTLIRFKPAQDQNGTAPALTVHLVETGGVALTNNSTINLNSGPDVPGGTSRVSTGTVTLTQEITPVNDAPVIAHFQDIQSHFEGDAARILDVVPTAVSVTDVDSPDFNGGSLTVTISGGDSAEDVLGVLAGNLVTSDPIAVGGKVFYNGLEIGTYSSDGKNGAPLTIDFGTASKTAVQALIGRLTYFNTDNDDPTVGGRSIEVVLNDGDVDPNGDSTGTSITIVNVQAINDVTVVGGDTAARSFVEGVNGAADHILANDTVTLVDVDDDTLTNVKISIVTNYASAEDRLAFVNDNAATFGDVAGSFDIPTGVLTLTSASGTATLAQFEAAIRAVTYDNLSEEPSTATRTVRIVADDPPAGVSNNFEFQITLAANNDSPSGTTSTQTLVEDTVVEIKEGLLGFGDADGDAFYGVRLTEAPTGGKIYYDSGSGPVEVTTFDGSITYLKTELDAGKLTFVPTQHLAGTGVASFKFVVVDDGGTTGTGNNADPTPRTLTFDITPVNDEPQGSDLNSATIADDLIHTFTVANFQDNLVDAEGDLLSAVQLVSLPSSSDGIIYYDPDGAAPKAAINADDIFTVADLIAGRLTFDPAATGSNKDVTVTFKAIDNGTPSPATDQTPNTFTFHVTPANIAPAVDLDGTNNDIDYEAAYTENDATGVLIGSGVDINDPDVGDMIEFMTVTITDPRNGDVIATGASVSGFTVAGSTGSGGEAIVTISGTGTAAQYEAILSELRFRSTSDNPTNGGANPTRTIEVVVNDGGGNSPAAKTVVTITATPDAPTGQDDTLPVAEDGFRDLGTGNFNFQDPDGDDFQSVTITNVTGGKLYIDANGGDHSDAVEAASTVTLGLMDFAGGDKVFFRPTADSNAPGSLTFTLKDNSGVAGSDTSAAKTLTFNITPANDHPNLQLSSNGPSATLAYVENDGARAIAPTAVLTDIDSDPLTGGSLLVSFGATGQAGDALGILAVGGITVAAGKVSYNGTEIGEITADGTGGSDLSVTFGAGATLAAVDKLIEAISYANGLDNPSTAQRTVTYTVNDGDGGDALGLAAAVVHFTNVNDAPVVTVPVGTQNGTEDVALTFSAANLNPITISDVDIGGGVATVVLTVPNGELALGANVAGLALAPVGNNSGTVTIVGTVQAINDALDGLTYTGPLNANGARTLTVAVSDNGFTGPNLIVNPGAEIGASASDYASSVVPFGWTRVGGTGTFTALQYDIAGQSADDLDENDSAAVGGGNSYFAGGPSTPASTGISQTIDVSGAAAKIDAGKMLANLSGLFGGYLAVGDSMTMTVNFLSATNAVLGSSSIGGATPGDRGNQTLLIPSVGVVAVPPLTRSIEVVLTAADGGDGNYGNGYADNLSLILSELVSSTVSINLAPVDDPATPQPDTSSTAENATQVIDVRSNDTDVDSAVPGVTSVGGLAISTGQTVELASGAKVTLNANGTLTYNPNGKFVTLNDGSGGAVNTSKDDVFSYVLADGSTSTVTMTVTGVSGPGDWLAGDSGPNTIAGTPQVDLFMLQQGGNDTAFGLASNDAFVFGAAMTSDDKVDGGSGTDQILLQGDYASTPLTFGTGVVNVEVIALMRANNPLFGDNAPGSFSYDITTVTENVADGKLLLVDAAQLRVGENFTFNGSAETDGGAFRLYGGLGIEHLTGGSMPDLFQFADGRFGASDVVIGGGGRDTFALRGNYNLTFGAGQLSEIEVLALLSGRDAPVNTDYHYNIKMVEANVASGQELLVDAGQLRPAETFTFDGILETNGTFRLFGGRGNDTLTGGANLVAGDNITGGLGGDSLTGGGGNDKFIYRNHLESTNASRDTIQDFSLGDLIDVSKLDAKVAVAGNQAFSFIGSNSFSNTAGELRVENVNGATWLVQADIDGVNGADLELLVVVTNSHVMSQADFVL